MACKVCDEFRPLVFDGVCADCLPEYAQTMAEGYIAMGRVLEAHESRHFFRNAAKKAKAELDRIQGDPDLRTDWPEGGGQGTESWSLICAKGELTEAVGAKKRTEKHFKALKLSFLEQYPDLFKSLETRLAAQSAAHETL
jgi:hypothetical protein